MKFPTLAVLSHVFLAGCASALFAAPAAAQEPEARAAESGSGFAETAEPFLARYCVRCHGPRQQKGGLRLDTLSHDFGDLDSSETWRQVFYRVRSTGNCCSSSRRERTSTRAPSLVRIFSPRPRVLCRSTLLLRSR